ncbi:MAG: threonine-phosphate decarboxylase CobD, partial [Bacillota bacterium]
MAHGGRVWEAARSLGVDPAQILDFSANLNPLGPPPGVMALLRDYLGDVAHYPEPRGGTLKRELARHLDISPNNLMVGNGAAELIYCFCRATSPRRALIPAPSFSEYARGVRACGGEVCHLPLDAPGFRLPGDRLAAALRTGQYDLAILGNPNNPTGTLTRPDELAPILEAAARTGTWLLLDESFLGFLPRPEPLSLRRLAASSDGTRARLAVVDSFTKLYCLPGLRLGYLTGPTTLINRMEETRDPWSVNVLAQVAGIGCLGEREYVARTRRLLPGLREALARALSAITGLKIFPSAANFLLLHTGPPSIPAPPGTRGRVAARLARRLILVRDCSDFPGLEAGGYIRVAVRLPDENDRLVRALREVLAHE